MNNRPVVVLVISFVILGLVYSDPKLEKIPPTYKHGQRWARQGLPASVEDAVVLQDDYQPATHDPGIENDLSFDTQYGQEPINYDLNHNNDGEENSQDPIDYREEEAYINGEAEPDGEAAPEGAEEVNNDDNIPMNLGADEELNNEYDNNQNLGYGADSQYLGPSRPDMDAYDDLVLQYETRSLQAGDTFTAQEMLPIAVKLMKKVNGIGEGKGIISSATHPKSLADVLFERYFMAMKRIVVLQGDDIPGLDSLQALALSGEVAVLKSRANTIVKSSTGKKKEQRPKENNLRTCLYKLLRKRVEVDRKRAPKRKPKLRRRRVDLSKRLGKNRKVIVNPARRGTANKNKSKPLTKRLQRSKKPNIRITIEGNSKYKQKRNPSSQSARSKINKIDSTKRKKGLCRWKYECKVPPYLETCRIHRDCSKEAKFDENYNGLNVKDDENTVQIKQLRRSIGIDVIDEEVEKILAMRYELSHRENHLNSQEADSESIADYLNKIVLRQRLDSRTTPSLGIHSVTSAYIDNAASHENDVPPQESLDGPLMVNADGLTQDHSDAERQPEYHPEDEEPFTPQPEHNEQEPGAIDEAIMTTNEGVVPDEAIPDESVPDEVVPDEAMPEESVPDEAMPDEAMPDEAIHDEAMPVPEEGHDDIDATSVLEAKRRVLPGILKPPTA